MSLASLVARLAAGEDLQEIRRNHDKGAFVPPVPPCTLAQGTPKPAPVLAVPPVPLVPPQNDNPQSEPVPDSYAAEERAAIQAESGLASRWRLPDGREVWLSPPETIEQIQTRHPGAVPWKDADTVTVTELPPKDEATIRAWLASLGEPLTAIEQDIQTARRFPDTAAWLLARAHIDVTARAIPHTCGDCQHFTHDPEGGGIGTCAITKAGHPPKDATGYPLCYPFTQRRCPNFEPKEATQ